MTPSALLAELRVRGVELVPVGCRIRFRPASKVPPELLTCLRQHKAEVLLLLTAQTPTSTASHVSTRPLTWAYPWPDELSVGRRSVGPFEACTDCSAWSWVRYGGVVLCLACAKARLIRDGNLASERR